MSNVVNMSLNISLELAEKLKRMSKDSHASEGDVLCKAIYLMDIAIDSKKQGNKMAVVNDAGMKVSEIIGI